MSQIKLTYFDFPGGRGEPIRIALSIAGIEFEDIRISFAEFAEKKDQYPLKAVPVMEVDGVAYTQTNAMLRYAGSLANLYPQDPFQALLCDEVLDIGEDAFHYIGKTFGLEGQALKEARENLATGPMTTLLTLLDKKLEDAGGLFFCDGRLTVADLKVSICVKMLGSGMLDHIPTDLPQKVAPKLLEYVERIDESISAIDKK